MGLIARASRIRRSSGVSCEYYRLELQFVQLVESLGIPRAGFLFLTEERMFDLRFPFGIDTTTFYRMRVPTSLLSPGLSAEQWTTLFRHELTELQGYFSSHLFSTLRALHLYPFSAGSVRVYLVLFDTRTDVEEGALAADLHGDASGEERVRSFILAVQARFSFIEASRPVYPRQPELAPSCSQLEFALNNQRMANLFTISINQSALPPAVLQEELSMVRRCCALSNQLLTLVGNDNLASCVASRELRVVVFSSFPVDPELYLNQLTRGVSAYFVNHAENSLLITSSGTTRAQTDVLRFLQYETGETCR